jgi:Animal haem peroxidase
LRLLRILVYGEDPSQLDAFVGVVAEPHVPGTEFRELQLAIWRRQFEALRDGDRFFYAYSRLTAAAAPTATTTPEYP